MTDGDPRADNDLWAMFYRDGIILESEDYPRLRKTLFYQGLWLRYAMLDLVHVALEVWGIMRVVKWLKKGRAGR